MAASTPDTILSRSNGSLRAVGLHHDERDLLDTFEGREPIRARQALTTTANRRRPLRPAASRRPSCRRRGSSGRTPRQATDARHGTLRAGDCLPGLDRGTTVEVDQLVDVARHRHGRRGGRLAIDHNVSPGWAVTDGANVCRLARSGGGRSAAGAGQHIVGAARRRPRPARRARCRRPPADVGTSPQAPRRRRRRAGAASVDRCGTEMVALMSTDSQLDIEASRWRCDSPDSSDRPDSC